ncbi:MAG TPA: response regulator, partial [Deltaproteobacteria bacterium]|nr:response regulator [Deltaproteobacteria bacterium]
MKKNILVVDDEMGIRQSLQKILEKEGYSVETASNGEEAFRIIRRGDIDLLITDIRMAGMDGVELLKVCKSVSPFTEVIMITGHGELDLAIKSLQYEAARFITKPINHDALDIALKRVRERISMRKELLEYTQEVEQLVEEKAQKLIEAERMAAIGQTVATLAHAIKNIMGGLKGGIYVVEKGIELDNRKYLMQGWQMIKGNVNKIHNLAMDLLTLTKERE